MIVAVVNLCINVPCWDSLKSWYFTRMGMVLQDVAARFSELCNSLSLCFECMLFLCFVSLLCTWKVGSFLPENPWKVRWNIIKKDKD